MKITRGQLQTPVRACIYGTEGIGKTTLASQFPEPLILDTEDGSNRLDVTRSKCPNWPTLMAALRELVVEPQGFKTIIIDTIDWAAFWCDRHVCKMHGKKSLEDWAYGKGYKIWADQFGEIIDVAEQLVSAGLNVVFVAHAKTTRVSPPDQTESYDRYELDLHKLLAPCVKEWADLLVFCNYRTKVVEGNDGRMKAIGGTDRVMFAQRSAAYDAKNRFGLPPEMPMEIGQLAKIFPVRRSAGSSPAGQASSPASSDASQAAGSRTGEIVAKIRAAKTVAQLGRMGDRIDELASQGDLDLEQVAELMGVINARHQEIQPQEVASE